MKRHIFNLILTIAIFIFASLPLTVLANGAQCRKPNPQGVISDPLNLPTDGSAVQVLIGRVISAVLGVVGSLSLVMFIYGGFVWMTSSGNKERVEKGKNILVWASIGLVVIFTSYAIVRFLFTDVFKLSA